MQPLEEQKIDCPYCGEQIDILLDTSISDQNYIEDCQVCCRPITIDVTTSHDGELSVSASHENE